MRANRPSRFLAPTVNQLASTFAKFGYEVYGEMVTTRVHPRCTTRHVGSTLSTGNTSASVSLCLFRRYGSVETISSARFRDERGATFFRPIPHRRIRTDVCLSSSVSCKGTYNVRLIFFELQVKRHALQYFSSRYRTSPFFVCL